MTIHGQSHQQRAATGRAACCVQRNKVNEETVSCRTSLDVTSGQPLWCPRQAVFITVADAPAADHRHQAVAVSSKHRQKLRKIVTVGDKSRLLAAAKIPSEGPPDSWCPSWAGTTAQLSRSRPQTSSRGSQVCPNRRLLSSSHILACCLGYIHEPQGPGVQGADFFRSVTDEHLQLADQMQFFSNVLAAATVSHRYHSLKSPSRMNEKMVQNDVMNDKFVKNSVKNSVMNAQIDPKFVMDLSICKVGGWNILQPSNQTLLEEFIDESEPWLLIGIPNRDPFLVTQYLERHSVSSDQYMKKLRQSEHQLSS